MSVCLCVSLSARISQKPHGQILQNFVYELSGAIARSCSDENGIRYVLPVLPMTSCFLIMGRLLGVGSIDVRAILDTQ